MNKVAKGAVAAAIAGVLLLGGTGTLALWQDTENANAGVVSSGKLTLDAGSTAGTWTDISADVKGAPMVDPAVDKLIPGDVYKFTQPVTVTAEGRNLAGEFLVDSASLEKALSAWAPYVTVVVAPEHLPAGLVDTAGVVSFAGPGSYTFDVAITVSFARGDLASDDESIAGKDIKLPLLAFTLNQTRAAA